MTERLCCVCPQLRQGDPRVYARPNVCEGCRLRLRSMLGDILDGYTKLGPKPPINAGRWRDDAGREHRDPVADETPAGPLTIAGGQRVSGTRERSLPLPLDPLDLTMPARVGGVHEDVNPQTGLPYGDQVGYVSVATLLDSWVRDWRDTLRPQEGLPRPNVRHLGIWLTHRLDDACDRHPAVDEFAHEMRDLLAAIRRVNGRTEVRPEHLDVPCRRCDLLDMHRLPGQDRVECGSCGDLLTEDEYRRWVGILSASMKEMA